MIEATFWQFMSLFQFKAKQALFLRLKYVVLTADPGRVIVKSNLYNF